MRKSHTHLLTPHSPCSAARVICCLQSLEAPGLQFRQADEVRQLCRALLSLLDEAARIAPILQQEEKAAKDALTAAAASGDAAQVAQARISHGNLSSHYVNSLRDRLVSSGLEHKLPPACSKVRQHTGWAAGTAGECCGMSGLHKTVRRRAC